MKSDQRDDFSSIEGKITEKFFQVVSVTFAIGESGLRAFIEFGDGEIEPCDIPWRTLRTKRYETIQMVLSAHINLILTRS